MNFLNLHVGRNSCKHIFIIFLSLYDRSGDQDAVDAEVEEAGDDDGVLGERQH